MYSPPRKLGENGDQEREDTLVLHAARYHRWIAGLVGGALWLTATPGLAKTKITFWYNHATAEEALFKKVVQEFEAAHPDIDVEDTNVATTGGQNYYDKLTAAFAGGVAPDVFYVRPGTDRRFVIGGYVYDIDPLVNRDRATVNPNDFLPPQRAELTYRGKWWALPYDFSVMGLYYNRELFDKAGVAYPSESWTWNDFLAAGRSLTVRPEGNAGGARQWALANPSSAFGGQFSEGVYLSFGGPLFDEEGLRAVANNPGVIRALTVLQEIGQSRLAILPGEADIWQAFFGGQAAVLVDGSWDTIVIRQRAKFDFDVAMLPAGDGGRRVVTGTGGAWAISAQSKQVEAAWEFVKWLTSPAAARTLIVEPTRSLPPRQSLLRAWAEQLTRANLPPRNAFAFAEAASKYGRGISLVPFNFGGIIWRYGSQVLAGRMSPTEAALQLERDLQAELQRATAR